MMALSSDSATCVWSPFFASAYTFAQSNLEHSIVDITHLHLVLLKWAVVVGTARTLVSAALPE
jgi:hypothetical protein